MNSVRQKESKPIDLQLYDVKQMFDFMWLSESMNDLYEVCEPDDKLALIYLSNTETFISVKTLFGPTKQATINDTELQGSVISPIKASVSVDTIGKYCEENNENVYKYKDLVNIPPCPIVYG